MKTIAPPTTAEDEPAGFQRSPLLRRLERMALWVERPFTRLGGAPDLNPFYHTGTLAVFLWLIVGLTGLYLTLFYQFGFAASYHSVAKIEGQLLAHVIRAIHRYASGTAMILTLLHGLRLFFQDRFRGARWLAWVAGVVMLGLLWLDGVTGYWMIWDQRAQVINDSFAALLNRLQPLGAIFTAGLLNAEKTDQSWLVSLTLWAVHVLLFAGVALFFWWHIQRLSRPRLLPPRFWLIGVGVVVVIVSAAFPLGMLPMADFRQIPGPVSLDPFYLFYLPFSLGPTAMWLWAGLAGLLAALGVLPWLHRPGVTGPVQITQERCAGCGACAEDCPYKAIRMQPRPDGQPSQRPVAVVDPRLCAACGVCLGACDKGAISLGGLSETALFNQVQARLAGRAPGEAPRLVFTCERHAAQGARPYLPRPAQPGEPPRMVEVIPLPCVAALPPQVVARALQGGAGEVRVVGCPLDDCARREGNRWTEGRLTRTRLPRLRKSYANAPIYTFWLAPDAFAQALVEVPMPGSGEASSAAERLAAASPGLTWRNFLPVFGVLGILLGLQIWLSQVWSFQAYPGQEARLKLVLPHPQALEQAAADFRREYGAPPAHLLLTNGESVVFKQDYSPAERSAPKALVYELPLAPGRYRWALHLRGEAQAQDVMLYHRTVSLTPGQVWFIVYDPAPRPEAVDRDR